MILKTSCFLTGPGDTGPNYNVIGNLTADNMTPKEFAFIVKRFMQETMPEVPKSDFMAEQLPIRVIRLDGKKV